DIPADEGFVGVDGDAHVPSYLATTAVEAPRRRTPVSRMSRCARSTGIAVRRIITNAMTFTTGSCWPSRMEPRMRSAIVFLEPAVTGGPLTTCSDSAQAIRPTATS